jgi:ribosomal protein S3
MTRDLLKEIQIMISNFYRDISETPIKDIKDLGIHDIQFEEKKEITITIFLERPGLLIGYRGNNIWNLRNYFELELGKKVDLHVKEKTFPFLYPYDFTDIMGI